MLACQSIAGLGDFQLEGAGGATTTGAAGGAGGRAGPSSHASSSGAGGSGGAGGAGGDAGTTASVASSSASTSSGGGGCTLDHLVLSEVRTRGPDDGNQDFVEIFNPTDSAVTLTADFHIDARGESSGSYGTRWTGDGSIVVPAGGRALLVNDAGDNPLGGATPDGFYASGIPDGASVVLYQGGQVLDAVCFTCAEGALGAEYLCEGSPYSRDASCAMPGDRSVQRRAKGGVDGCADTEDNAVDLTEVPSTPAGTTD